ncbi:glutamyl-tRNA synthetase [Parelusimicrobium proximum]|uniref:glutamate--tRNA ligase n=1 Tax=Parelusimicrobium proximum TaxID=3228953 RepID=UPI003D1714EE
MVRVRFAPSPTGFLHIGGARTALFNYLFAKRNNGMFMLRIEDTDEERSTQESVKAIFDGMQWLDLPWDEGPMTDGSVKGSFGPYYQAERADQGLYKKYADQLIAEGKAYKCYCTPEELDEMRKEAQAKKLPPRYGGKCRCLSKEQQAELEAQGRKPVIRFAMPKDEHAQWDDMIRGPVSFATKDLYDLVIQKASGYPTYNFAAVIDDHLMEMTHVIRGDDHISNTPAQIQIYKAFGWTPPVFAHLSMIHGPDGTKLSKRHGATSVIEYQKMGLLPEAVKNYLALLGWSTSDSQQLFAPGELEQKFDMAGAQKSPAIFDPVKLEWMNSEYIRKTPIAKLTDLAIPFMQEKGIDISGTDRARLEEIVGIEHEKYRTLLDIPPLVDFFFTDEIKYDPASVEKVFTKEGSKKVLEDMAARYETLAVFKEAELEAEARAYAVEAGIKTGQVFHPVRVAVSGRTQGPTLFKMLEIIGRDTVVKRLRFSVKFAK